MAPAGKPEGVDKFKGKNAGECENFIQNIRDVAWTEGKLQDGLWMANFASLHYSGKALKWHSDLPLDVREDWFKQESALLKRWPPSDDEDDEATILPTPAAAPTDLAQRDKSFVTAALAFIPDNQTETFYVGKVDSDGDCRLTRDPKLALRFRWDREAKPRPRILECWSGLECSLLSVFWTSSGLSLSPDSSSWARLTVLEPATLRPAISGRSYENQIFRIDVWDISTQGQVTPTWSDTDCSTATLSVFCYNNLSLYVAVHREVYQKNHPSERHGQLMFKCLEWGSSML